MSASFLLIFYFDSAYLCSFIYIFIYSSLSIIFTPYPLHFAKETYDLLGDCANFVYSLQLDFALVYSFYIFIYFFV